MTTEWMKDPILSSIAPEKLQFLQELAFESNNIDPKKRMSYFLSLAAKSKQANIKFSSNEIDLIVGTLKKYATDGELGKIEQMLKIYREKGMK